MIEITVNRDGTVSTPSGNVFLGNKFENLDETLSFTFPEEFQEYNKYLIGYHKRRKATVILPINDDIFYVTTGLTYLDGDWTLYAMCRQQVLDLSTDEEVDISPKEGEHVFISDGFSATVASNNIDSSVINSTVLDQNLQVIYEDLLKVKEELKDEQPIVIDLNIPMNLVDHAPGGIQRIELDDVKIDRNLFLDDEGKCKQFVNVKLSSSGVIVPYVFLCIFDGGTVSKINYRGSAIAWQPIIDAIEYSNIITLDFYENDDAENSFVFGLAIRSNLIAGEYPGFVKSIVDFDPEQHTVPVVIDEHGSMFVPIYPTLESLEAKPKDFVVNLSSDGGYSIDKTFDEIKEAYVSGKTVYAMFISSRMDLTYVSDNQFKFSSINSYYSYKELIIHSNSTIDYSSGERTPDSSVYGIIRADRVNDDPDYTVSAKFNTKDGKLYIPTYPTLESLKAKPRDFIVTVTYNDSSYASDKTFDEIKEAYDSGRDCYAVYNMITCKLMSITSGAAIFMLYNGLAQNTIAIYKTGIVTHHSSDKIPSPTNYGGIKADEVSSSYTVPVKFNSEDGKAYVPTYPTLSSLGACRELKYVQITNTGQNIEIDTTYEELLANRGYLLISEENYQYGSANVFQASRVDGSGNIYAQRIIPTETGMKLCEYCVTPQDEITYSEKEFTANQ